MCIEFLCVFVQFHLRLSEGHKEDNQLERERLVTRGLADMFRCFAKQFIGCTGWLKLRPSVPPQHNVRKSQ